MADVEAMGRMISLALRSGIPIQQVHRQLRGISSDRAVGLGPNKVLSVPDAIGLALEDWMRTKQGVQQELLTTAETLGAPGAPPASPAGAKPAAPMVAKSVPAASAGGAQMMAFENISGGDAFIGTCPDCGSQLEFAEGCVKCHVCGFSECG